jgi:hypothetical protein
MPDLSSRASAAALSSVLKSTTRSCRNMRFSGICPAEAPQPIIMKFYTIDKVGKVTRCAKNGWNRLAWAAPEIGEIKPQKLSYTYLTFPYLSLFWDVSILPKGLNRFARTVAQTTRFAVRRSLLGVALIRNYISGSKPKILEPECQISSHAYINTLE